MDGWMDGCRYDNIGLPGNADAAMKTLRVGGHLVMIQGDLSTHPKAGVRTCLQARD